MSAEPAKEIVPPTDSVVPVETPVEKPETSSEAPEAPKAPVAEKDDEPVKIEAPVATPQAPVVEPASETTPEPAAEPAAEPVKVEAPPPPPAATPAAVIVPPPAPAAVEKKVDFAPEKPTEAPDTPLAKLFAELPTIIKDAEHNEMWGVELTDASHVPTSIVLEKFLRANSKDVSKAKAQLTEALKWRKKMDPAKLLAETQFDSKKFGGLGFVTVYAKTESHAKEIVTWNIYGAVKDTKETFGNIEE
jgi:hypothetical protein